MISVVPLNDEREHCEIGCWCEPRIEWVDSGNGLPFNNGPKVIHNAADHREAVERLIGESLSPEKNWAIFES